MTEFDPVLTDSEILERARSLVEPGVADAERAKFARFVHDFQRGTAAEEAVRSLIGALSEEHVANLVREDVIADQTLANVNYCEHEWTDVLAARLVELGFDPVDQEDGVWRVGWPGAHAITGEQLCRVGLLATWLRKMSGLPGT